MHEKVNGSTKHTINSTSPQLKSTLSQHSQPSAATATIQQKSLDNAPLSPRSAVVLQRMLGNRQLGKVIQAMQSTSNSSSNSSSNSRSGSAFAASNQAAPVQLAGKPNHTGMPDQLKSGVEALSGIAMDDVKVHYNSTQPQQLNAHAYAQGSDIHIAPGQERHLPHEAWHVVQQRQGRVKPTAQLKGVNVNDNEQLEKEATEYGNRAMRVNAEGAAQVPLVAGSTSLSVAQLMLIKIKTEKSTAGRVISSVEFEGRVPTSAESGQGDHTVADYLPKLMLQEHLFGKTHKDAATSMGHLFDFIDNQTKTSFKNDNSKMVKLTKDIVIEQLNQYQQMANDPSVEGEDLNTTLENLLDGYLRLWNKRAGSAYNRSEGLTSGGGGGVTEKEAKKQLIRLGKIARENGGDEQAALDTVPNLMDSIDFVATDGTLKEASDHINMSLELMLRAYPEMEQNGSDVMYNLVAAYAQKMGLDETQAELILKYCYESYYGESYDVDMN